MAGTESLASKFQKYFDPGRKVGSQSEQPAMMVAGGVISVAGYQVFKIAQGKVIKDGMSRKYRSLYQFFQANRALLGANASLLDIGCSAGILCFLAKESGFAKVTGIDHDPEYIEMMQAVSRTSGLEVDAQVGDWKAATGTHDVVCMLALIHWVYSLTGTEGSFSSVYRYLHARTGKYLLIEWVDPADPAIGHLKHTSANPQWHREPYERERFEIAGQRYFGPIDARIDTTATRCIYVFRKEPRVFGHSSVVRFGETAVVKTFHDEIIKHHPALIGRERKALAKLEGVAGIPYVLAASDSELHLTFGGEPISAKNLPPDATAQAHVLVEAMKARGIRHNDIHRDNVLVHDGRLNLIDFAWSCGTADSLDFLPKEIGVNYGVRTPTDPVDDLAMLLRTIEIVGRQAKT